MLYGFCISDELLPDLMVRKNVELFTVAVKMLPEGEENKILYDIIGRLPVNLPLDKSVCNISVAQALLKVDRINEVNQWLADDSPKSDELVKKLLGQALINQQSETIRIIIKKYPQAALDKYVELLNDSKLDKKNQRSYLEQIDLMAMESDSHPDLYCF